MSLFPRIELDSIQSKSKIPTDFLEINKLNIHGSAKDLEKPK